MTKRKFKKSKQEKLFAKEIAKMENGQASRHVAAKIARLPLSTFQYQLKKHPKEKGPWTYLLADEERK